jgi:hypothetical protein
MNDHPSSRRTELERIRRVSDMLCSGHAALRDRYARRALLLDVTILGLSTWLVALTFVQPQISFSLTPFRLDPALWIGFLAIGTFFMSLIQTKVDWKKRSDAHRLSCSMYADVHREVGYALASSADESEEEYRRLLARYDMATASSVELQERAFLPLKKRHMLKIAISRLLDTHPGSSIAMVRVRFWLKDNFGRGKGQ